VGQKGENAMNTNATIVETPVSFTASDANTGTTEVVSNKEVKIPKKRGRKPIPVETKITNLVDACIKAGYTGDTLTRSQILNLQVNFGLPYPQWLTTDENRKVIDSNGNVMRATYSVPELAAFVEANPCD
jgi:hypothetical protein